MSHFVYLYRDQKGKPRYVGYGENSRRALEHIAKTHNLKLESFLKDNGFKLEIAGPFESEETAKAVETALISVLRLDDDLTNVAQGHQMHRFRPIGVPSAFVKRWEMPPLEAKDFAEVLAKHHLNQFLCVLIQNIDFGDGRGTFDPANPPDDPAILQRVIKTWPLRLKRELWSDDFAGSPAILLAVHGKPGTQFVIASLFIDRKAWSQAPDGEVPVRKPTQLNAAHLRGRRIAREAGLKFNQGGLILFP